MPINTAEKRRSASAVGFFLFGPDGVTPNVNKDQEWRQQAGYGYSGILTGGGVAGVARLIRWRFFHRSWT